MTERRDDDQAIATEDDAEVVDALPVAGPSPQDPPPLPASQPAASLPVLASPAAQVAAVAATGFAVGAATVAISRHRKARKLIKRSSKGRPSFGDIVMSRSFMVDVHLLNKD